jgi:hypothetical protein
VRIQQPLTVATLALGLGMTAFAQSAPVAADSPALTAPGTAPASSVSQATPVFAPSPAVRILEDFKTAEVKFDVNELAEILRDRRHEGWVLAAYPDPKTAQPLIGAGFSLDLPAREHPQPDQLNPHSFLEPSSADLWQAAGFDPARLDGILKVFYERRREWSKRTWRKQMMSLPEQISDEEAMQLVRIGAIQAIYNARAYCRNFDEMTGPQQMAMAQLVYQMGVNLEHFNSFLALVNPGPGARAEAAGLLTATAPDDGPVTLDQTAEYWTGVQKSLMTTQWARLYRTRAVSVIAMLDPAYRDDPTAAERRVGATLRPAVVHRQGRHAVAAREVAATTTHRGHGKKAGHASARKSRKRA